MKKILSVLLIAMLLIQLLPTAGMADTTAQYTVENKTVQIGDTFTIDVGITNNPGIISLRFQVVYDMNALKLLSVENKALLEGFTTPAATIKSPYILRWADSLATENNMANGTVVTLKFEALQVTSATSVTIEHKEARNATGKKEVFENATATVTVKEIPVDVTGVTLDQQDISLKTGESQSLTAAVSPENATNKALTWTSSDEKIATVDNNGMVTGVSKGTTVITVTTQDGNFSDTCTVTVACAHAHQTSIGEKASDCKTQGWDAYKKCDDCGQLLATDGIMELDGIPYRELSEEHTGGTATCTQQAICSVCGEFYGNFADHDYTKKNEHDGAMKTAGTCCQAAEYWYSCSACGRVERNDSHTFLSDKDKENHTGGTAIENAAEADHKEQKDGYTGDTKCLGCGDIIEYGKTIPAGSHVPADVWSSDEQYHWKECTVVGCGIVIDGTKMEHSSSGENVATCQKRAVCDVCGVSYGTVAAHIYDEDWSKDETGHWHACLTTGCTDKNGFAGHTPDHEGGATEEYPIKCTVCGFIIEQQLPHNHVFTQEVVDVQYLASDATCMQPAKYYFSCACGQKGTETFTHGDPADHMENTTWETDEENHWHTCAFDGCDHVFTSSKASHTPDREAATETEAVKCSVCGYEIEPALGHTHAFGEKWEKDENSHWHACACGEKTDVANHVDENKDGECDLCAYSMSIPTVPTEPEKPTEPANPTAPTEQTKPTEPSTTAEPEATEAVTATGSATNEKPSESPKTGDGSMILLWSVLVLLGGLGLAMLILSDKKRKTE